MHSRYNLERVTRIEELVSVASEPLAPAPEVMPRFLEDWAHGAELFTMLQRKNGFYAFESALHVFPVTSDPGSGLEGWNAPSLWRAEYREMAEGLLFFAEDIFQDQFCLASGGVMRFLAETGDTEFLADSIEAWADLILSDYARQTGWRFAHEWKTTYGPLPRGKRLIPKLPFILGGKYELDNLWAGNPLEGLSFKADIAMQTRGMEDGAKVRVQFKK